MDLLADLVIEPMLSPIKYRIVAALIDFAIVCLIAFVMCYLFGEHQIDDGTLSFKISGFPAFILFCMLFSLISIQEGLTGKTIGKRILKIKVLKKDSSESTLGSSIIRHLFDAIDMIFGIGLIIAVSGKKKQRIGDLVAKTIVVKD